MSEQEACGVVVEAGAARTCTEEWATLSQQLGARQSEQALQVCESALDHAASWDCSVWAPDESR